MNIRNSLIKDEKENETCKPNLKVANDAIKLKKIYKFRHPNKLKTRIKSLGRMNSKIMSKNQSIDSIKALTNKIKNIVDLLIM